MMFAATFRLLIDAAIDDCRRLRRLRYAFL